MRASFAQVTAAATTDPTIQLLTPTLGDWLQLPDGITYLDPPAADTIPVTVSFTVANFTLGPAPNGNRVYIHLNGQRIATVFDDSDYVIPAVSAGQHSIGIYLADTAGAKLTEDSAASSSLFRITRACTSDTQCAVGQCSLGACVARAGAGLWRECAYGKISPCCESVDWCPPHWFCHKRPGHTFPRCTECLFDAHCDDGDFCTINNCNPETLRCETTQKTGPEFGPRGICCSLDNDRRCDDGKICTIDSCNVVTNSCANTAVADPLCCENHLSCDDGNVCNLDRCYPGGFITNPDGSLVLGDDGLPIPTKQRCRYGRGTDPNCCMKDSDCVDRNPCTRERCDMSVNQCIITVNTTGNCCILSSECNDNEESTADFCKDYQCQNIVLPNYCDDSGNHPCTDDGNPCTIDSCVNRGCRHDYIPNCCTGDDHCDDNDPCTKDECIQGGCQRTPLKGCCKVDADCNDGDICTSDLCRGGRCLFGPNLTAPDPCCSGSGKHCRDRTECTDDSDCTDGSTCTVDCDDNNECTVDACNPDHTCSYTTGADLADGTKCCTTAADCNDNNAHTADSCIQRKCQNTHLGTCQTDGDCDDKNPCTTEVCGANGCESTAVANCCNANSECDDSDTCTRDFCDLATNTCDRQTITDCCTADADCDNGNACDDDFCVAGGCRSSAPEPDCVACTTVDECDDHNDCTDDACDATTGKCVWTVANKPNCCDNPLACNDGDTCTEDKCINKRCQYHFRDDCCTSSADCDDNNICTRDMCAFGACKHIPLIGLSGAAIDICCRTDDDCPEDGSPCTIEKCGGAGYCTFEAADPCEFGLPYVQRFDDFVSFPWYGWKVYDLIAGVSSAANWTISTGGSLGPDGHLRMKWSPTIPAYSSRISSPLIDLGNASVVTVQFEWQHRQFDQHTDIGLYMSEDSDWDTATPLWVDTMRDSQPETLSNFQVPQQFLGKKVYFAFASSGGTTYHFDSSDYDNFKVVAGQPPEIVSVMKGTKGTGLSPLENNRMIARIGQGDAYTLFARDPDGEILSFQIVEAPSFVTISYPEYHPARGAWGVIVNTAPHLPEHAGPFEMKVQVNDGSLDAFITVEGFALRNSGYVVWKGGSNVPDAHADAVLKAIEANGRTAQVLDDLLMYDDTTNLKGIFVILGLYGADYTLDTEETEFLEKYLDLNRGRLYIESGDGFSSGISAGLKNRMHIRSVHAGLKRMEGPAEFINFMRGRELGVSQNAFMNNYLDRVARTDINNSASRILMRNGGNVQGAFAATVAYHAGMDSSTGRKARSIGTSVPFAALVEKGQGTRNQVMGDYLYFFEAGMPACASADDCDDNESCTEKACVGGNCVITPVNPCTTCQDDRQCGADEACLTAKRCEQIPGDKYASTTKYPIDTNPDNTDVTSTITVPAQSGAVQGVQVKLELAHAWVGEVEIKLRHAGRTITLKQANLGDSRTAWYHTYDLGMKVDDGAMSYFFGQPAEGDWDLILTDKSPGFNGGVFNGWSLHTTVSVTACSVDSDCNDNNACTEESCGPGGYCTGTIKDCTDYVIPGIENKCTTDTCDADTGCMNAAKSCNDANACTNDSCFGPTGTCKNKQLGTCAVAGCITHADCGLDDYCDRPTATCTPITGTVFRSSGILPALVPDAPADGSGLENTIVVSNPSGQNSWAITNLMVKVYVTHSFRSDLTITLEHDGQPVTLHKLAFSDAADNVDAVYDDIDPPVDVLNFAIVLEDGQAAGSWTLTVKDTVAGDQGELQYWAVYIQATECTVDADCNDANLCTTDTCDFAAGVGTCKNELISCDDEVFCNGVETCDAALGCQPGTPVAVDDGVSCTTDSCDEINDKIVNEPKNTNCDDGNVCTTDVCDAIAGCQNTNNTASCDDGYECTDNDTCNAGKCKGSPSSKPACQCTVAASCPEEGNLCLADYDCVGGQCVVVEGSETVCGTGGDTTCSKNTCDPNTGYCGFTSTTAGIACDDGDKCTDTDLCDGSGNCVGVAKVCNNGNYCDGAETCAGSSGNCQDGSWVATDDGVACTQDACDENKDLVVHTPDDSLCDDGDPCTDDTCDATLGCVHTYNEAPCDDGQTCTSNDVCTLGVCQGTPGACECIVDADCNTGAANLCDGTVACVDYVCQLVEGTAVTCDQSKDTACMKSICQPASGACQLTAVADDTSCNDGDMCTAGDVCKSGVCGGTAVSCDDGRYCNGVETCDASLGCQPGTPPTLTDGVGCTNDVCNEDTDSIDHLPDHTACMDGNGCTDDVCDPAAGCTNPNNTAACDDQDACTINDTCAAGTCTAGARNPACDNCALDSDCPGYDNGNGCDAPVTCVSGSCVSDTSAIVTCAPLGALVQCAQNACNPATGSCERVNKAVGVACNDGSACTDNDSCDDSGACRGEARICVGGGPCEGVMYCNAATGQCDRAGGPNLDDNNACTLDLCDKNTGEVVHLPQHNLCDDNNSCTDDTCDAVKGCEHATNQDFCDDGNSCTTGDRCSSGTCTGEGDTGCTCTQDSDCPTQADKCAGTFVCTAGQCEIDPTTVVTCDTSGDSTCAKTVCVAATGQCVTEYTAAGVACDDVNACTISDKCDGAGNCTGTTRQCEDGLWCNGTATCNPITGCVGGTAPNPDDGKACTQDYCDEVANEIKNVPNDLGCDDDDPCTDDICDPALGCRYRFNQAPCDDGVFCSINDRCNGFGKCDGGGVNPNPACHGCESDSDCPDDNNPCNGVLSCDAPGTVEAKCKVVPASVITCDRSVDTMCQRNTCDPADGQCKLAPKKEGIPCDDGTSCTVLDACDAAGQCGGTQLPCDDSLFCNGDETCNEDTGQCAPGVAPVTDDRIGCTADSCDEATDRVLHVPIDARCDNAQYCDGAEVCTPGVGCDSGTAPVCDDSNDCTSDKCDPTAAGGAGACDFSEAARHCDAPCSGPHDYSGGDDDCGFDDSCVGGLGGGSGTCTYTCALCEGYRTGAVNEAIPNNNGECLSVYAPIETDLEFTKEVMLRLDIDHDALAHIDTFLTDPSGHRVQILDNTGGLASHTSSTWSTKASSQSGPAAAQPLCRFRGFAPDGTWKVEICDNVGGAGGSLKRANLFVQGTDTDNSAGNTCENAQNIDVKDGDVSLAGETECAWNNAAGGCGGGSAGERVYRMHLLDPMRVTVKVTYAEFDHVVYFRHGDIVTCASVGSSSCTDAQAGTVGETHVVELNPGYHYLFFDGVGGGFGAFEATVTMQTLKPNGDLCAADSDCLSGFCTDGVCCNTACAGTCRSCDLPQKAGVCSFYAPPSQGGDPTILGDPEGECPPCQVCSGTGVCIDAANGTDWKSDCAETDAKVAPLCQNDGMCDGAGKCRKHQPPTVCIVQSCTGQTLTFDQTCNGTGTCLHNGTRDCHPYVCNGPGTDCRTFCTEDPHCVFDHFCDSGVCKKKKPLGQSCTKANECLPEPGAPPAKRDGICKDGVCCNEACTALCEACNNSDSMGYCDPHDLSSDPEGDCGICDYCDGNSACTTVPDGTDNLNHCPQSDPTSCGLDGQCDGAGLCRFWHPSTLCVAQLCTHGTSTLHRPHFCSGDGSCVEAGDFNCPGGYMCNSANTDCLTTCGADGDCQGTHWCNPDGTQCALKKDDGDTCYRDKQCKSDHCVDGYCCDTACDDLCEACNLSGKEGDCTDRPDGDDTEDECGVCDVCNGSGACRTVADGLDPYSECAQDSESTCDQDGVCDGSGDCRLWALGTECVEQNCAGHVWTKADLCDGVGGCSDKGEQDCAPYMCAGQSAGCADGAAGRVAYVNFNEGTGYATDEAISGGDFQLLNTTWETGAVGGGVGFAGTTGSFGFLEASTSCAALAAGGGWPTAGGSASVCGESDDGLGGCNHGKTLWQAVEICANAGARLCTQAEVQANETASTGCGMDDGRIWTSDACEGGFLTQAGNTVYLDNHPKQCTPAGSTASVRCCADVAPNTGLEFGSSSAYSIEAWIKPTVLGGEQFIFSKLEPAAGMYAKGMGLMLMGNKLTLFAGTIGQSSANVPAGRWSHVVATFDGNSTAKLYVEGVVSTENSASLASTAVVKSWPAIIGASINRDGDIQKPFKGVIDNVYVYNRVLSASEVTTHRNTCMGRDKACLSGCSKNAHCVSTHWCNNGTCVARKANGQACAAGFQCVSDNCVDGVCCDTQCDGPCVNCATGTCKAYAVDTDPENDCPLCQVCNGAFVDGTQHRRSVCVVVADGLDPLSECTQKLKSSCQTDGKCDGNSACRLWALGTICKDHYCDSNTYTGYADDTCDGGGTCTDGGSTACFPYVCNSAETACRTSCSSHDHCQAGQYCSGNKCVPQKAVGARCYNNADISCLPVSGSDPRHGFCTDGYCCTADCAGTCQSCKLDGKKGTCTNIADNTDPEGDCSTCKVCNGNAACRNVVAGKDPTTDCAQDGPETCKKDGYCDGNGACRFWSVDTVCLSETCVGSTHFPTDYCPGNGTACVDSGSLTCANGFMCAGNGLTCRTSCAAHGECQSTFYCAAPNCLAKKSNGATCSANFECTSGQCTDGRCCESACAGTCETCANAQGQCRAIPDWQDPAKECGTCSVCNGARACRYVAAVSDPTDPKGDPLDHCQQQSTGSCGRNGACNGSGVCELWKSGTQCVAKSCDGMTYQYPDLCDGRGVCVNQGSVSCSPYLCAGSGSGAVCRTSCANDSHCDSANYWCNNQQCVAKKNQGATCTGGNQCKSGHCVDGKCCDTACDGQCVSCATGTCTPFAARTDDPASRCATCKACSGSFTDSTKRRSACVNVTTNTDPLSHCATDSVASCDQDGTCNGSGACKLYSSTTVCNPQSCTWTTQYNADKCDGSGTCKDAGTVSCHPYKCKGNGCPSPRQCSTSNDCVGDHYCSGNQCIPKQSPGTNCGSGGQCLSGHCVDGVCCDDACGGTCMACNLTGKVGKCTPIAAVNPNTDPAGECSGACQVCKVSGSAGACGNASNGSDPDLDCSPAESQFSCGRNGQCWDGQCAKWSTSTVCGHQSCVNNPATGQPTSVQLYSERHCDGRGTCNAATSAGGSDDCSRYACNASGNGCRTDCNDDVHCRAGNYCGTDKKCHAKKANGGSCTKTSMCQSGYCVDGVCCNNACNGSCRACNKSGSVGTCTNHARNTDPEGECSGACKSCNGSGSCTNTGAGIDPENDCQAQAPCGRDGQCNGGGGCRMWASGTVHTSQSCSSGKMSKTDTCNGSGGINDGGVFYCDGKANPTQPYPGPKPPAFYACSGVGCHTSCANDSHCGDSSYVCVNNKCEPKRQNGASCSLAKQCTSGNCVNRRYGTGKVCCNSSCGGSCKACDKAGSVGTCTNVTNYTNAPYGTQCAQCKYCVSGSCTNIPNGQESPHNACPNQVSGATPCAKDGKCNGSGSCRYAPTSKVCRSAFCAGAGISSVYHYADKCDGAGNCGIDGGTNTCNKGNICKVYDCAAGGCTQANKPNGTRCKDGSCNTGCGQYKCITWTKPRTCQSGTCTTPSPSTAQCKTSSVCKSPSCSANGGCSTVNLPAHGDSNDNDDTHTNAWLARERYCENVSDPRGGSYGVQHYRQRCNGSGGVLRTAGARTDKSNHGWQVRDYHDSCWPYKCWSNNSGNAGSGNGYQCRNHCYMGGANNNYCASGEHCTTLYTGPRTCSPQGGSSGARGPAYECTETCSPWPYPH